MALNEGGAISGVLYWGLTVIIYLQHVKYKSEVRKQKLGLKYVLQLYLAKQMKFNLYGLWYMWWKWWLRILCLLWDVRIHALCKHDDYIHYCILYIGAVHQCHCLKLYNFWQLSMLMPCHGSWFKCIFVSLCWYRKTER